VFDLRVSTSRIWLDVVMADFDHFMLDHTLCERKASAMGMSLVAKYPDRALIVDDLIAFAREELEHFHIMYRLVHERGLVLPSDEPDEYVNELRKLMQGRRDEELFLDRLLVPGIVEARGCERLHLVSQALEPGTLRDTYLEVTRAEARHHALFFRLAERYFKESVVEQRAAQLLDAEAEIVERLPVRPCVH
jgi:tRNA 2-(methylsulfanyl)-N6-isopentenyladenosine37 hydroxylase